MINTISTGSASCRYLDTGVHFSFLPYVVPKFVGPIEYCSSSLLSNAMFHNIVQIHNIVLLGLTISCGIFLTFILNDGIFHKNDVRPAEHCYGSE